jgi:hypothetical protein
MLPLGSRKFCQDERNDVGRLSVPKTPSAGVTVATESEHDCG